MLLLPISASGVDSSIQSETGAIFPKQIVFCYENRKRVLDVTGVASRKILFFDIYSIANYLETMGNDTLDSVSAISTANTAKQIIIHFERTIQAAEIREQFRDSYVSRASVAELAVTRDSLESFLSFIQVGVDDGDRFAVRKMPGGRITVFFKNKKVTEFIDPLFGQIFWSIWLGNEAVVERAELLERLTETGSYEIRNEYFDC